MIKAERNMRADSDMEQIMKEQRKLKALNSLEKRTKNPKLFEKSKNDIKRNIEKIRKGK
ncbi:hypothetical protein [Clostridium beijerinckii]|uniref:Uncharacterized protein n=1 Tax=Clostridium beijerinckii TaxID=1520 RepID=A0AAX0B048_CLOBE|nr:hypothetical protein [Clostridium beijerinckii]NRT88727.1 hypothetical protein [Clostridium beijerinckii]NYC74182.1 hypothetical protein [Clostridium beijerinckii]